MTRRIQQLTYFLAWAFFALVMYLILTDVLRPWIQLPAFGNIGFTLAFVLFAVFHCAASRGWRTTAAFFLLAAVISYLLEEFGVRTGWIYGAYHYSNMLGPKLGNVPLLIPLAWFMMIYPSWIVARTITRGIRLSSPAGLIAQAFIAAITMTAWDTVMDPGMAAAGNWIWEHGGGYFGVPLHNYLGWLFTTFLVYIAAGILWRTNNQRAELRAFFFALPIFVYALYSISYIVPRRVPALQVVALFSMGLPTALALTRVCLPEDYSSDEAGTALHIGKEI